MPACALAVFLFVLHAPLSALTCTGLHSLFWLAMILNPVQDRSVVETAAVGVLRRYTEGCESFGPLREGAQAITKAAKFLRDGESCRVVCTGTNGCASPFRLSTFKEVLQLLAGKTAMKGFCCRLSVLAIVGRTVVSGTAPMQWHIEGYSLPPIPAQSSECSAGHGR